MNDINKLMSELEGVLKREAGKDKGFELKRSKEDVDAINGFGERFNSVAKDYLQGTVTDKYFRKIISNISHDINESIGKVSKGQSEMKL